MDMRSAAIGIIIFAIWLLVLRIIMAFCDGHDARQIERGKLYMFFYGLGFQLHMKADLKKILKGLKHEDGS